MASPALLHYPFTGRWLARNSPARKVPSHGTHLMGTTYAIDFIGVGPSRSSGPRSWRTLLATEPPEIFYGFGREILAPCDGRVVSVLDGEPDHAARRSQLALVPYMAAQPSRARGGPAALAGNHVVIALAPSGPYVLLAHLRRGSVGVSPGDQVTVGQAVGACGNSGNSTQPHVHVQVTDSVDWPHARGLPMAFLDATGTPTMPAESEIVDV